jgi:hypothetical protein
MLRRKTTLLTNNHLFENFFVIRFIEESCKLFIQVIIQFQKSHLLATREVTFIYPSSASEDKLSKSVPLFCFPEDKIDQNNVYVNFIYFD